MNSLLSFFSRFVFITLLIIQTAYANQNSTDQLRFSAMITAESAGSLESMVVESGSWFTKRKLVHAAILVNHPKGSFLYDSGIGKAVKDQMSVFNFFEKQLFKIENIKPARDQLETGGFDFSSLIAIIPSHMHWDHASGIEDFVGVPVWLQKNSHDEALHGKPPGFVLSQYDDKAIQWNFITLQNTNYEGFSHSLDVFEDGSVILVDLSGHTHGQLGMFLNLPSGERYFFIGDTTWAKLGVTQNKPRPKFVHWMVGVDSDYELNNQVVEKIHNLSISKPNLVIVPAHDEYVNRSLPQYPEFSK